MRTGKQIQRQEYRETTGRYSKVKPCARCNKSAGLNHYSDPRHANTAGNATLVLCGPCAGYLATLSDAELDSEINSVGYGKMPQGQSRK